MTLILNPSVWDELHEQAPVTGPDNLILDDFEELTGVPEILGQGYCRSMELSPGLWLNFSECEYHQDLRLKVPAHDHPIQITILLSGSLYCDIHPTLGGTRSYFSGSGVSPGYVETYRSGQRLADVNIEIKPDLLDSFFLDDQQRQAERVRQLFRGEDWKVSFYPTVTPQMRSIAQQMWNVPYRGELKRLYLQAKVMELLVIYLDLISNNREQTHVTGLKPDTIDRLHHARTILSTRLENPPSIVELAQQVGVSDRTLQRGFKALFNTTIVGYLQQQRLEQAEMLLRQGNLKVSEVATAVGYGNMGHFAVAFKRRFGITPSQCLAGKRVDG
jgi:AraC-like DNA-binding protein